MFVYIHSHNTGFMLGKEILRKHSKLYVDLMGSSGGFLFLFLNPAWHHRAKFEF